MKLISLIITLFLTIHGLHPVYADNALDSVGVTTKAGNNFIIHKVTAGETLYSISRKYSVSVQSIKEANTEITENLKLGQNIMIPIQKVLTTIGSKSHIVKSSETLYSISRQYNVPVADLRKWNNLSDDNIAVGQKLVINTTNESSVQSTYQLSNSTNAPSAAGRKTHTVAASQTLYSISRMYNVTTDEIREWNRLEGNSLSIGQVLIVSAPSSSIVRSQESNSSMLPTSGSQDNVPKDSTLPSANELNNNKPLPAETTEAIEEPGEKIVQKGMAELVENPTDTKKYLALHRNAPIGTIMQVRNEMNNQTVFVRIVGSIPPTGDNAKVILQISKKAYDRLGAVDSRFPVEISYLP